MEISVIVPVYNVENYLKICLNSIINQSFDATKYEIILVDDGSTDNSGIICDNYAKKYSNIRVIHKKNGGLSDARNYGIDNANGKYLTFIDSDDAVGKYFLEILYDLVKKYNVDISSVAAISVKKIDVNEFLKTSKTIEEKKLSKKEALAAALIREGIGISAWAYLYDKKLFNNIRYPKGALYEDLLTTPYILDKANKGVAVSDAIQYLYYVRNDSITHRGISEKDLIWFRGMDKLENYLYEEYSHDLKKEFQARYLTDIIGILCNRAVFEKNATKWTNILLKRNKKLWKNYLRNPYIKNRVKAQIFVLKLNRVLYRNIIKRFL